MIENLEFEILHLKADRRPGDSSLPICYPPTSERLNTTKTAGRIPQALDLAQPVYPKFKNRSPKEVSRKLTQRLSQSKHGSKTSLQSNKGKSRNMGGLLFTCDASPHSPWSILSSRKSVVGAGLLVHNAAHIAKRNKNTYTTNTNNKNPHMQCFKDGMGLCGLNVTLLGSSFEKFLAPGSIQIAGDIRRDL
jgi:hypothetical protein